DDDDGSHVGVRTGADQRTEMQLQVFTELQAAVRVRQRQGALDIVGNGFGGGVRDIVDGKNDDVVTHTDPTIVAAVAHERGGRRNDRHVKNPLRITLSVWTAGSITSAWS